VAFPSKDAEVEYWDSEVPSALGVIEALNGTTADIRISADDRLEEGVEMETENYHPIRGYRKP
jgi:hypothetical protein